MTKQKAADLIPKEGAKMSPEESVVKRLELDNGVTPEEILYSVHGLERLLKISNWCFFFEKKNDTKHL